MGGKGELQLVDWRAGNSARSRLSAGSGRLKGGLRPRLAALQFLRESESRGKTKRHWAEARPPSLCSPNVETRGANSLAEDAGLQSRQRPRRRPRRTIA